MSVLIKCLVLIIILNKSCAYVSRNMAFLCFCVCLTYTTFTHSRVFTETNISAPPFSKITSYTQHCFQKSFCLHEPALIRPSMEGCSNSERDSSDERDIRKLSCHSSGRTTSFSKFSHQTAVRPGRIQNRRRRRWQAMSGLRLGSESSRKTAELRAVLRLCSSI